MLRTYSTSITATAGTPIVFNTNKILTNSSVTHSAGTGNINVNEPGYYKVDLDISATIGTTGLASIQLYADGVAIPDAIITNTYTATEYLDSSFSTIIKAAPGTVNQNVTLTIKPTADLTVESVALGINRLA